LNSDKVIESSGRTYPVETRYLGRAPGQRVEDAAAQAVRQALREEAGSILVFLPGQGEIMRTAERLNGKLPDNVILAPLYGALDGRAQDRAINPAPSGARKVVLASAIAQTSLTIDGIRVVIDCGLARVPKFEPQTGLTRLETVRVSRASADQRRGRAGRIEPGVCYRLWDEAQTAALPAAEPPEILEADLCNLALDLASWGASDPQQLAFLDPPPAPSWSEAVSLLEELGALDRSGRLTLEGQALASLPIHPRLGHMIRRASQENMGWTAALVAALVSEPGLGGRDPDLRHRLSWLARDPSQRAKDTRQMAERWLKLAGSHKDEIRIEQAGRVLAFAYPDRVAEARGRTGSFRLANGRGAELDESHALAMEPFLCVADIQGKAARGRIALCAPFGKDDIEDIFGNAITQADEVTLTPDGKIKAHRVKRYKKVVLDRRTIATPDPDAIAAALIAEVRRRGVHRLPWSKDQLRLRTRIAYLREKEDPSLPDLSDNALQETLDKWLRPYLAGLTRLEDIEADVLGNALHGLIPFDASARIDKGAPSHFEAPTGSRIPIDYGGETGPTVSVRVQELFGLTHHPAICNGALPLTLELLSPAHRPIQITRDLPGFWQGSWADVKADMKGRYPKHEWPDNPAEAPATARAKPRKK